MLTEQEKGGVTSLLRLLSREDLFTLAKTVTNGQITVTSDNEALRAIVTYTATPLDLLKRKKVKKDVIFKYLFKENIGVNPNGSKLALVRAVLNHWGSPTVQLQDWENMEIEEDQRATPPPTVAFPLPPAPAGPTALAATQYAAQATPQTTITHPATQYAIHAPGPHPTTLPVTQCTTQAPGPPDQVPATEDFAKQFSTWYYAMLNSHHPSQGRPSVDSFGIAHFYPDCSLKLLCLTPEEHGEIHQGSEAVCERLLALVQTEHLWFNPNTDMGGVKGVIEHHGLHRVMVCGTLHRDDQLLGIFEQQFGLVRDPTRDNNWRVKFTNLKLGMGTATEMPTLQTTTQVFAIAAS